MTEVADLVAELRRAPRSGADALIRALGLGSQPTFSRLVARAGDAVVAIGRARARRYAAAREVPELGMAIPAYRVDARGQLERTGTLRPIAPAGLVVDGAEAGSSSLADLRPTGFLGAAFANRVALGLSADPRDWSDDETLLALATAGEDLPGDRVIGDASARRYYAWRAGELDVIDRDARPRRYAALAEDALRGVVPSAIVAGEQPKFGAIVAASAGPQHVLVKFSPAEYSPVARRWCDLLVSEHLALDTLRAHGVPAVASEIVEGGSRVFLETVRFDRVGAYGRRAVARHAGAAARPEVDAFARFVDDTEYRRGTVTLVARDDGALAPAPVHGLLPMGYAPVGGELPERASQPPPPEPGHEAAWRTASGWAVDFWQRVAVDDRVSRAFRTIARENTLAITRVLGRFASRP